MVSQHDTKLLNKDVANNGALDGASLSKNQNTSSTALILEGGSYRGIFTAGVLDVLREKGVTNFESVWGTSAGAINAVSFKSKQIGRAMRIMLAFRDDPRFMSFRSLVTTGNIAGGEFMYEEIQNHLDPCDNKAFNSNPMQMYAVASDVTFGTPAYLHVKSLPNDIKMVQASASMPTVSRMVELDGHRYLDGGTTDSIPFAAALGLPDGQAEHPVVIPDHKSAKKALVIVTQDHDYVKTNMNEQIAIRSQFYTAYPYYEAALASRSERYMDQRKQLFELQNEGRVLVLEPPEPVEVKVNEKSGEALLSLYLVGRQVVLDRLEEIKSFIE